MLVLYRVRSKIIDVRCHWIKDALNDKLHELEKVHIGHNDFDMFMKTLSKNKLKGCCSIVRMTNSSP